MAKTLSECMTALPHSIGKDQPLRRAVELMKKHGIRHLPVLHGGELVGVLTERDIAMLEAMEQVDPETMAVEEGMSGEPYAVRPDTPMKEVLSHMADRKLGSAIAMDAAKVVGIFTSTDAIRMLAALIDG